MKVTLLITEKGTTVNMEAHVSPQSAERALIAAARLGLEDIIQNTANSPETAALRKVLQMMQKLPHANQVSVAQDILQRSGIASRLVTLPILKK